MNVSDRPIAVLAIAVLVIALAAVGASAMASAQGEFPSTFYGEVEINGEPAADFEDVTVSAVVDGTTYDTIEVDDDSMYGGPTLTDPRLEVPPDDEIDDGDTVEFEINGENFDATMADQTADVDFGADQQVDLTVDNVEIDPDDPDDDPAPGTGTGTGPAPDEDDDVDAEPPEPPADVDVEVDEDADLEFDEETGQTTATFGEDNAVESISFGFDTAGSVNARTLSQEPDETGPSPGASTRVAQITVGEALQDQTATVRMRVPLDRLDDVGADAEDLRMNRFADGEWQGLETEVIGETDTHVRVEAETPGFSYFSVSAVSEPEAAIDAPAEVEAGEEFELDGSDSADEYGEIVAHEWDVDGETLTGETVTAAIDSAGDATVELTVENDAGETDTATATVSVLEEEVEPEPEPEPEPDDGLSTGLIIGAILFVAIVAIGALLYARRQNE